MLQWSLFLQLACCICSSTHQLALLKLVKANALDLREWVVVVRNFGVLLLHEFIIMF
jgi:hypothetical protein